MDSRTRTDLQAAEQKINPKGLTKTGIYMRVHARTRTHIGSVIADLSTATLSCVNPHPYDRQFTYHSN